MGQYYLGYVRHDYMKPRVFSNKVDGDYNGLKLMEHSWWRNRYVGNVVNDLFYNKGRVCWVGDYYDDDDYAQVNCDDRETVKAIGESVWKNEKNQIGSHKYKVRFLDGCLLVNHTKKEFIVCDDYYEQNKFIEHWNGKDYPCCIHPLPLLTCSASHSGGSYRGSHADRCGIWFNDEIEVVLDDEIDSLKEQGYSERLFEFKED